MTTFGQSFIRTISCTRVCDLTIAARVFIFSNILYNKVSMGKADLDKLIINHSQETGGDFFSALERKARGRGELSAHSWHDEGQLAVDVAQTDKALVITAAIAGVKPEDLSININNDLLTIRGKREKEVELKEEDYFYKECYWGSFSRTIVLPVDVLTDEVEATFKNGVLTVIIPKESNKKEVKIKVVED